jgi:hypothetical protein
MQHLEGCAPLHPHEGLSIGYASALEVARRPEGDCTEHAVCSPRSAARSAFTRVVDGWPVDAYADKQHVFVRMPGHRPMSTATGVSTPALAGFDAGHGLSYGDGDPWRFFSAFNTLGRIRIDAVEKEAVAPRCAAVCWEIRFVQTGQID